MSEARRLLAPGLAIGTVSLGPDAARHARVLRLAVGEDVVLFDGLGREADARIDRLDAEGVTCGVLRWRLEANEPTRRVVLLQALPKGGKLDDIVRATTECGVGAIHLAQSERSVVKFDAGKAGTRVERLVRIAQEAARQSERAHVPAITAHASVAAAARCAPASAARLVLSPRAGLAWTEASDGHDEVWLAVGPEGGFSPDEERHLQADGWVLARLALPVLRVETAAPVAVAMLRDRAVRADREHTGR